MALRIADMDMCGYWQGLYDDLLWRMTVDAAGTLDEKISGHAMFRDKLKSAHGLNDK